MSIQAAIFDFGGVLITTIANQIRKVADLHGAPSSTMHEVLLGPRASGSDHPWHMAERGEIAITEIQGLLRPFAQRAGIELRGDEIDRLLAPGEYTVVDEMIEHVRSLRTQGYRTGLLTNTFAEFRPTMERDLDLAMFDAVIESFAVGARKPEPAIYDATEAALGCAGTEIVFLDDFDQNLAAARARGWHTIHVTDHAAAIDQLQELMRQ